MIKEGQVIGYLDQFGTELPVKVSLLFSFSRPEFALMIDLSHAVVDDCTV